MTSPPRTEVPKSCFGFCCKVTTCVYVIAAVNILGLLAVLAEGCRSAANGDKRGLSTVLIFVLGAIVIGLLTYGVRRGKSALLIPFMVFNIMSVISSFSVIIFYSMVVKGIDMEEIRAEAKEVGVNVDEFQAAALAAVILSAVAFVVEIFCFLPVVECYRYLKKVERN